MRCSLSEFKPVHPRQGKDVGVVRTRAKRPQVDGDRPEHRNCPNAPQKVFRGGIFALDV